MKTVLLVAMMIGSTVTQAMTILGPISSGGTSQIVMECTNASGDVKLSVYVEDNSYLVARLEDYSGMKSSSVYSSEVSAINDGFRGDGMVISVEGAVATATVLPKNPKDEPRVFANLSCVQSIK